MTRTELHNITGFHPASLVAAAAHLRANFPRKRNGGDATHLINNEGWMNGYLDAIAHLVEAAAPQPPEAKKREYQPYAPPTQLSPENSNQK